MTAGKPADLTYRRMNMSVADLAALKPEQLAALKPEQISAIVAGVTASAATPEVPKAKGRAAVKAATSNDPKLDFTYKAIRYYRQLNGNRSKGIHTKISGFNQAFRSKFPNSDPIEFTKAMEAKGLLQGHPAKLGHMIYLPGEMPTQRGPRDCSADLAAIDAL